MKGLDCVLEHLVHMAEELLTAEGLLHNVDVAGTVDSRMLENVA